MNSPQKYVNNKTADTLRAAIENEAKWIYYLTNEGIDRGLSPEFAKNAMNELGEYYADTVYSDCSSPKELADKLMNRAMEIGQEAVIENLTDSGFSLVINYCPKLNMWNQLCDDETKKKMLCDVACTMYCGIGKKKGYSIFKACSLACDKKSCRLTFQKADN